MSTLSNVLRRTAVTRPDDVEWLHLLVGDWQVLADLAFADLVLWLPTASGGFVAGAHARSSTGATVHQSDVIGQELSPARCEHMRHTVESGIIEISDEPRWTGMYAVREERIPVVRDGEVIAVVSRETHLGASRTPSPLENNYIRAADAIAEMIATGDFPQTSSPSGIRRGAPRVGDGLLILDADGRVLYGSPNGLSCFHRLGTRNDLVGSVLAESVTELVLEGHTSVDETLAVVIMGRAAWRTEVETPGAALSLRAIPVLRHGRRLGALLLVRDVSEIRRRERELLTKDATIREIHHRVKNNLQTVAALLRLQSRRSHNDETKSALAEAVRRVDTIAVVHQALSQTLDEVVDFDELFGRVLRLVGDVATTDHHIDTRIEGIFGRIGADAATSLVVVLAELVTNAVEHGLAHRSGRVVVRVERDGDQLDLYVTDNGEPVDLDRIGTGLGTQIVQTLVQTELHGTISWGHDDNGETLVTVHAYVGAR